MLKTAKPFRALTAGDLMSREVVTIPCEMSLQAAAHRLAQAKISGAPVVDQDGCCVGVLSATDFMKRIDQADLPGVEEQEVCSEWQVIEEGELPEGHVDRFMTGDPVTVPPTMAIAQLAQVMLDAHIHRLIVVDELKHPVGIVSSSDVLAAVARIPNL